MRTLSAVSVALALAISGVMWSDMVFAAETVRIACTCKTKNNPSQCNLATVEWQSHDWTENGFKPPGNPMDAEFLRDFCYRKKDDQCLCDTKELFSGKVE